MNSSFKNDFSIALNELLLNRSFCFTINKNLSNNSNIIIYSLIKETINYKNIILTISNLRLIFKDLIKENHDLLINDLLLGISSEEYSNIILEEFFKVEDRDNSTLYLYFRDLHPNKQNNNN